MAKATIESLKKRKNIDQKIDDLADIMAQGFYDFDIKLTAEIQGVKKELRSEIGGLRTELHQFRAETRSEFSSVRSEIRSVKQEISDIKKQLDYVFNKAMESSDILVEDVVKLQNRIKKLEKQVAYLEVHQK